MPVIELDFPLQGALAFAKANRYVGAQHAVRNPCYILRGNDGFMLFLFIIPDFLNTVLVN